MLQPIHITLRSILAILICVCALVCVRAVFATEQLKRDLLHVYRDAPESHLSGFLWQHPVVLSIFAIVITLAALTSLAFSKVQRKAVMISLVALAILLVQWLVIIPSVDKPAEQMLQKLNTFVTP